MADITQNTNDIPELQSPFEQLREVDADGREWWNSRKLARVMGYGKYWNFERVIAKAQAWASRKGYHLATRMLAQKQPPLKECVIAHWSRGFAPKM